MRTRDTNCYLRKDHYVLISTISAPEDYKVATIFLRNSLKIQILSLKSFTKCTELILMYPSKDSVHDRQIQVLDEIKSRHTRIDPYLFNVFRGEFLLDDPENIIEDEFDLRQPNTEI